MIDREVTGGCPRGDRADEAPLGVDKPQAVLDELAQGVSLGARYGELGLKLGVNRLVVEDNGVSVLVWLASSVGERMDTGGHPTGHRSVARAGSCIGDQSGWSRWSPCGRQGCQRMVDEPLTDGLDRAKRLVSRVNENARIEQALRFECFSSRRAAARQTAADAACRTTGDDRARPHGDASQSRHSAITASSAARLIASHWAPSLTDSPSAWWRGGTQRCFLQRNPPIPDSTEAASTAEGYSAQPLRQTVMHRNGARIIDKTWPADD